MRSWAGLINISPWLVSGFFCKNPPIEQSCWVCFNRLKWIVTSWHFGIKRNFTGLNLNRVLRWSIFPGSHKLDFPECLFWDGIFTAISQKKYSDSVLSNNSLLLITLYQQVYESWLRNLELNKIIVLDWRTKYIHSAPDNQNSIYYLCLLEIISVFMSWQGLRHSRPLRRLISKSAAGQDDHITHRSPQIFYVHIKYFSSFKIFCWSDWKLVPISIWWRCVICLCCSIQYQLLKKEYKIAWFLQVAQVASVCSLRRFKNTKMHF